MLAVTHANVTNFDAIPRRLERGQTERKCSIKILVVDAHFLIREALRDCLKAWDSSATILEAVNGHEAMQLVSEHSDIRLIVLELNLPDLDGFDVLGELRERHPKTSVVVLSTRHDRDSVTRALDLGALGFIPLVGALGCSAGGIPLLCQVPQEWWLAIWAALFGSFLGLTIRLIRERRRFERGTPGGRTA